MTIRQIIADFWVKLERETGEIPYSIALRPQAFDKLLIEAGAHYVAEAERARQLGRPALFVLQAEGREMIVARAESPTSSDTGGAK